MARLYEMPDPNDRSVNAPTIILEPAHVLSLYNQQVDTSAKNVSESVRNWFIDAAKQVGWHSVSFSGNKAILEAKIALG